MRTSLFAALFAFATAGFAQQQAAPQPQQDQEQLDKQAQERVRTERAAGGLGKVTEEDKRGAAIGESPHKERKTGAARRDHEDSPSSERQAGRGATR